MLIFTGFNNIARVESFQKTKITILIVFLHILALLHSTPWLLIMFIKYSMNSFQCLLVSIIRRDMGASNCRRKCSSGTYGPGKYRMWKINFRRLLPFRRLSRADDPALIVPNATGCGRAATGGIEPNETFNYNCTPEYKGEEEEWNLLRHFWLLKLAIKIFEEVFFLFRFALGLENTLDNGTIMVWTEVDSVNN